MVTFTGSTEVGKLMLRYAGESNLKRVALELGGKSPQVVLRDADLAAAASDIAWGIFYNQGETCNAGSRLICEAGIKDELLAEIKRVAATITPRPPARGATCMGALIDEGHMRRVLGYIDGGVADGAAAGAGRPPGAQGQRRLLRRGDDTRRACVRTRAWRARRSSDRCWR